MHFSSFVLALCAFQHAQAALSAGQIKSVFGNQKHLKGLTGTAALSYDLTLVANSSHALVVMQALDPGVPAMGSASKVGYLAIAGGKQMKGSDDYIVWPNKDGSWTLSHRYASGEVMPKALGAEKHGDFELVKHLCTKSGAPQAQVAFLRKLKPSYKSASANKDWSLSNLQLIYSRASLNPGSSSTSAKLAFHDVSYGKVVTSAVKSVSLKKNFGSGKVIKSLPGRAIEEGAAAASSSSTPKSKHHKGVHSGHSTSSAAPSSIAGADKAVSLSSVLTGPTPASLSQPITNTLFSQSSASISLVQSDGSKATAFHSTWFLIVVTSILYGLCA